MSTRPVLHRSGACVGHPKLRQEFRKGCFDKLPEYMESVATTLDVPQRDLPRRNVQDINYFDILAPTRT